MHLVDVSPLRLASLATSPRGGEARHGAQMQVLVDSDRAKLRALVAGEGGPGGRVVDDFGLDHSVVAAEVLDPPLACRFDVLIPGGVLAERPRYDEAIAQPSHADRRGVLTGTAPAAVIEDADDGHPRAACDEQDEWVDEARGEADDPPPPRSPVDCVGRICVAHGPRTGEPVRM